MIDFQYALAGALTGLFVGLTGVGGGALMTPILLLFFGISPATAIATDLWFAVITKTIGAFIHYKKGNVDWIVVRRLWMGSIPIAVAIVGYLVVNQHITKSSWLTQAIGGVVLVTAIGLIFSPILLDRARKERLGNPVTFKLFQPVLTILAGGLLGLCVALTSVGAGALGSVLMLYLYPLRLTPHRLVATDIMHAIPLAFVAGIGYLLSGLVNWGILISLLIGSVPAIIIGSLISTKLPGRYIQILLALMLALVSIKMLFN